jgi:glycosyltransferase involved in cell wall biosynthesis
LPFTKVLSDNMPSKNILLFDTDLRGHHADYISSLIDYQQRNPNYQLTVVTDERLITVFEKRYSTHANKLTFVGISESEITNLHQQNIFKRSYNEWQLFCRFAKEYQATQGLLMYFDVFQIGLLFGSPPPCPVSGIYFRPDFHYKTTDWKSNLNALRKKWMLRRILDKPFLNTVFSLDKSAVTVIKSISKKTTILPISDPVRSYEVSVSEVNSLQNELGLNQNKKTLLLFGFLDDRKGIEKVISALELMDSTDLKQVQLVLVGVIATDYQEKIEHLIRELPNSIIVKTAFEEVKGAKTQQYFELSDYVLALYQQHVGMSQIVIRAAISRKPLISSDYGLVGKLVSEKALGITVDSANPEEIAKAFTEVLKNGISVNEMSMEALANENSETAFASTIFGKLLR